MNLLKALATVSGMTLLSRILGFVRDFVIARAFGAGFATDAFFVAFRLPNLLRRMFAEGAFSQAFVPILSEYRNTRDAAATHALINHVASLLALAVFAITVLGVIGAPFLIYVSAPGFSAQADKFELTVQLTRIVFPYIWFMSLTALAAGVLNTWSKFAIPAVTPALLNLAFIGMALFAAPYFDPPVLALAWAVVLGGVLQLGAQCFALARLDMLPRPSFTLRDPGVNRILKLMVPAILGVSVSQISLVINTIFASFLPSGSVSWLYYADRLMEFPSGLLGAALGTILLPSLSKLHAQDRREEFSELLDWGLRLTLMLTLPAALALAILAVPLLSTLFLHGAFTAADVLNTRSALVAYSLGLSGLILVKVLAPAFYSRQDVRTPVRVALLTLGLTQLMNLAFVVPLKHAGLALSIGLASLVNALLLYRGLRSRGAFTPQAGWTSFSWRLCVALAVMGGVLWWSAGDTQFWLASSGKERLIRLCGIVLLGIASYFGMLYALGFRLKDFRRRAA
ncbi:MAG: murein biosynthesis integral membrane protein MurJ [Rhodocyclaceae bacterium]|nr:murein biosynthesis integral membrane protein MurJ [Rhodocyclaceae bacterium]MBX3669404.1 murein biosynthesis integral membrane protein MurJ [Rhodocyclaceae bacterium]